MKRWRLDHWDEDAHSNPDEEVSPNITHPLFYWDDIYLRGAATISDEDFILAVNKFQQENNINNHGGRRQTSEIWVNLNQLADHFNIHRNRIASKLRRTNKRKLTDGCTCGCRGDIVLLPLGRELMRKTALERRN
jgi:hypothetical protein